MRCAIYVRVSTDKEEQKASLKYQKELFFNYVAEKGWDIFDFYIDVESGTTGKRENFQRMIEDAQLGKFDVVLAKELSRVARNGELSYKIKNLCENQGIHIITLDNAINTLEGNTHMFGLYAWIYEQESQHTSNRVKETLNTRAKKGLFKGSIAPYGYEVQDGKLVIRNDFTPDVVRRIFRDYLKGIGRGSIAKSLYNEGVPTPAEIAEKKNAGDKWHESTIRTILTNPHYTGDLIQGRTTTVSVTNKKRKKVSHEKQIIIKDAHEPIIPYEVFQEVQRQLVLRTRTIHSAEKHLFTELLYCSECGSGMWYRQNGKRYICGLYARHGKKACQGKSVKEKELEEILLSDIRSLLQQINTDQYLDELELKVKKATSKIKGDIDKLIKQVEILKSRKKKYINMLADNHITKGEYLEMVALNNDETAQKLSDLENLNNSKLEQELENLPRLRNELLSFLNLDELTSEVLGKIIDRIEVNKDGSILIKYRFSNPF